MNVKSLKSQLFAAVVMMLVACVALGSSTYAWFAINEKVTATGMSVTAETSSNLLIVATDTAASTSAPKNLSYGTTAVLNNNNVMVYPVSTIDGENFFYTDTASVGGVGEALSEYFSLGENVVTNKAFDQENGKNAGDGVKGYVDYTFMLKAIGRTASDKIVLDKLTLTYGGNDETAADAVKAFRVAMFVEEMNADAAMTSVAAGTAEAETGAIVDKATTAEDKKVTILTDTGEAQYFESGKAVKQAGTFTTAAEQTARRDSVTTLNTAAVVKPASAATTTDEYFRVVLRIWLEGEDQNCNVSDFLNLNKAFALDAHFTMDSAASAVEKLTTANSTLNVTVASATTTTTVVNGVTYYLTNESGYYTLDSNLTASSRIFTISGNDVTEVTNEVKINLG